MPVMKTHGVVNWRSLALLLVGFVFLTQLPGCEQESEEPNEKTIYIPGGYKKVPPENVPANIDGRLLRAWTEEAQFLQGGSPVEPARPVIRFWLYSDGRFGVDWRSFEEHYWDYWGHFSADQSTGELVLKIEGGNYVPADFQGRGKYHFDNEDRLILSGIWLGWPTDRSAIGPPITKGNGHRFRNSGNYAASEADGR